MKPILIFSAAFVALAAAPAAAQDFAGARVEGRLGYDWNSLEAEYTDSLGQIVGENNEDGLGFGAELGYDFPVGPGMVAGAYVGIDFSDADFCRQTGRIDQACLEVRRNIYLGARLGGQIGGSTLIYGKAGYSNGQGRIDFIDENDVLDDLVDSGSRDGWHFGVGVEQNFGSMVYGKLEYTYTIYSDLDFSNADYDVTLDGNRSQLMAGFGLRF